MEPPSLVSSSPQKHSASTISGSSTTTTSADAAAAAAAADAAAAATSVPSTTLPTAATAAASHDDDDGDDDDDHASSCSSSITPTSSSSYLVLVEFFYKHLDFQMAELTSILDLYGITVGSSQCRIRPLLPARPKRRTTTTTAKLQPRPSSISSATDPNKNNNGAGYDDDDPKSSSSSSSSSWVSKLPNRRPFVILEFPMEGAERLSTTHAFEFDPTIELRRPQQQQQQQQQQQGDNGTNLRPGIAEILSKCTLVKSVMELWTCSPTLDECATTTQNWLKSIRRLEQKQKSSSSSSLSSTFYQNLVTKLYTNTDDNEAEDHHHRHRHQGRSWKMTIHTLGRKFSRTQHNRMRKAFGRSLLDDLPGPVRLENPNDEFLLIRETELDSKGSPLHQTSSNNNGDDRVDESTMPLAFYFGRVLGGGTRNIFNRYTLKKRPYLGPTSMDAELSFVMTSLGQVRKGTVVYDPFVGTGSILLACALRGSYCVGSDIDIRVLRGKGGDQTIWNNFDHYGLTRPEILRTDNALYHRHFRHHQHHQEGQLPPSDSDNNNNNNNLDASCLYDAILCDPPYGIRAGARKTGSRLENPRSVREEDRHDHIAQTRAYPVSDVMADLVDVAARTLNMGGRLVYIIPSFQDFDPATDLPRHDCLQLIHSCYQPFSPELGRRIVAMKKICDYEMSRRDEYMQSIWVHGAASADKCANLRDKLIEAAKQKPGYEGKAAMRREKRKAHKEDKKLEKKTKQSAT